MPRDKLLDVVNFFGHERRRVHRDVPDLGRIDVDVGLPRVAQLFKHVGLGQLEEVPLAPLQVAVGLQKSLNVGARHLSEYF